MTTVEKNTETNDQDIVSKLLLQLTPMIQRLVGEQKPNTETTVVTKTTTVVEEEEFSVDLVE